MEKANKPHRFKQLRLSLMFAAVVFVLLLATVTIVVLLMLFFSHWGWIDEAEFNRLPLFVFAISSVLVGTILAAMFSRAPLKPLRAVMDATDRIADGDYSVRLNLEHPEEFRALSEKFNHMAQELGSVEMLRSDFVNSFSHELKTPIVSIRGFAKALKWDDLTDDERNEYLDIIIHESERLCDLSTNVLLLSKFEQQTILTDTKPFNLTEQIRQTVALLYSRWNEKQLEIELDAEDFTYTGNSDMLRQVWINLLDNAIKFSPEKGKIIFTLSREKDGLCITCRDQGAGIPPEIAAHVFDKFYQGDAAHHAKGNGLGLSIAKRIVELHRGNIEVISEIGAGTQFIVHLP